MKDFKIGRDGFTLPASLITSTQAILARKRSGKSYTASVQAEEMLAQHQQVVVIDPTSAWYGLRSSADGKGEGYAIVVFGGKHADAPLDWRNGREMAVAIVEHGFSAIFDIGGWNTKEQVRFVFEFCSELLRLNESAMHVFMDEFGFTMDPCPLGGVVDGTSPLFVKWRGERVFCNPPYGPGIRPFLDRGMEADCAVFLIPARTDTRWFHEVCLPFAKEIRFIKGRLKFGDSKNNAPFPSMIVIFERRL